MIACHCHMQMSMLWKVTVRISTETLYFCQSWFSAGFNVEKTYHWSLLFAKHSIGTRYILTQFICFRKRIKPWLPFLGLKMLPSNLRNVKIQNFVLVWTPKTHTFLLHKKFLTLVAHIVGNCIRNILYNTDMLLPIVTSHQEFILQAVI